jgi:hypothetical protein
VALPSKTLEPQESWITNEKSTSDLDTTSSGESEMSFPFGPSGIVLFRFESSDGIIREEEGTLLDENTPDSPVVVKGSYSYPDETGKLYTVRYIADENGFHPEGDHIKVPPYVVNPQVFVQSTPRPPIQLVQGTPRAPHPGQFVPGISRPPLPVQFVQSTPRPQFVAASPTRFQINPFSSTPRPEVSTTPTRIQIPLDAASTVTPKSVAFNELDNKLQSSIVNLLANGDGRGFNIAAVNSI